MKFYHTAAKFLIILLILPFFQCTVHAQPSSSTALATKLISSFTEAQMKRAVFEADVLTRYDWSYLPASMVTRSGVPIKDFSVDQKKYFYDLLAANLSEEGNATAHEIMSYEYILKELEPNNTHRIPENYFITFYGKPSENSPWAWKFTGHHLSLNFTYVGDKSAFTPFFLGSNPGMVKSGPKKGNRIHKAIEDLGFDLVKSMNPTQLKKTMMPHNAFADILTTNAGQVGPFPHEGINASELNETQKNILTQLISAYLANMPKSKAKARFDRVLKEDMASITFAYAGGHELGLPHYYRVQGKTFVIEFDNTQNDANHVHAVWRDFDADFGRDLLREHYKSAH
jgi:hypothetical protein